MNIYDRPTPRTDEEVEIAKKFPLTQHGLWVSAEHARRLEQELETCREAHIANCLAADTLRREIRELRERGEAEQAEPDAYAVLLDDPNVEGTPGGCGYWYVGCYRTEAVAKNVAERGKQGARVVPMRFTSPQEGK